MRLRSRPAALGLVLLAAGLGLATHALAIPAKAHLAQVLLDRAWQRTREGEGEARPWPWADVVPVARLAVPRLDAEAVVLGGTSGEALAFGPGHLDASVAVGAPGTAVLAGHRDTHFRFLRDLAVGDLVLAQAAAGPPVAYRVVSTAIVAAGASGLEADDGGPTGARLALVTCWPFDGVARGPLRYVVVAERAPLLAYAGP